MNVFFDLECANCHMGVAKICEFGYVLTDDQLNIISAENRLIDPRSTFNVYGFKKAGISFCYDQEAYRSSPPLKDRYEEIKSLLCDKNNRVFGYSVEYDAEYIRSDFERSHLKPIDFEFIDVMKLYRDYLKRSEKLSLDVVYSECGDVAPLVHHEAKNDSLMTIACLKRFMELSGMSLNEVVNDCPLAYGELFDGRVVKDGTAFHYTKGNRMSSANSAIIKKYCEVMSVVEPVPGVFGKTFCFDKRYSGSHFAQVLFAAKLIAAGGGDLTNVLGRADYIVVPDRSVKVPHSRRQRILSLVDFTSLFALKSEAFDEKRIDVDEIIGEMPENVGWYEKYKKHIETKRGKRR